MNHLSKKLGILAAVGVTCGSVLTAAPQASAASWDYTMHTDDGDPGGLVRFKANGDYVEVCDIEEDGWAAYAFVTDDKHPYHIRAGGNGNCSVVSAATAGHNLNENQHIHFEVCLVKSSGGNDIYSYCDTSSWWNG
ncbi:hypothetical protein AB0L70_14300 [Kribbella sp. NPDC051952]|uniref:hypothetical protein n=1 Tax=Kribbella sp. NPDC051952 TaxID=3154851 RepID=UPI003433BB19